MLMKVTDSNSVLVYDPRGIVELANVPIAARPKQLDGLRLGILDNSKWNANKVLRASMTALEKTVKFGAGQLLREAELFQGRCPGTDRRDRR